MLWLWTTTHHTTAIASLYFARVLGTPLPPFPNRRRGRPEKSPWEKELAHFEIFEDAVRAQVTWDFICEWPGVQHEPLNATQVARLLRHFARKDDPRWYIEILKDKARTQAVWDMIRNGRNPKKDGGVSKYTCAERRLQNRLSAAKPFLARISRQTPSK